MKKILFLSAILVALSTSSFAQYDEDAAYVQGQSTLSAGYGFGSIWKRLFKLESAYSQGSNKVSATGPFSLTYEYGLSERVSGGLAVSYSQVKSEYIDPNDPDGGSVEKLTNFSILARGNLHFGSSEKFDPYVGLGVGYYNFKYEYKDSKGNTDNSLFPIPGAFGYNAQLGAKYYFSPSFGAFAEVGYVAGGFGQVGLTAKF